MSTPQNPEPMPVLVRAYASPPPPPRRRPTQRRPPRGPSRWTLVFDTETTTDPAQQLRFGCYQIYEADRLHRSGLFYDPLTLSEAEQDTLRQYAAEHALDVRDANDFVEAIFFPVAFDHSGLCVGFNLPFDLSRLAIRHAAARGVQMYGGFSLQLSSNPRRPRVQVRHLSRRAALIRFTVPPKQRTPRGQRKRGLPVPARRGHFIDVRTFAGALLGGSWSLGRLSQHLGIPSPKAATEEHGQALTPEYLDYAVRDVQATWECWRALRDRYAGYGLTETPPTGLYSEASIGKAYLLEMGVQPWRKVQPDFPPELLGIVMSTYYGGRSEVRQRRAVLRVLYCDFLSMYPTVCTLMGLWRFVIAEGVTVRDATDEVRDFLANVTLEHLQQPETWRKMGVVVQVAPDADIFPVRARYGGGTATIGLNVLTADEPLWFTLADCIASRLLTGKAPKVLRAWAFTPGEMQSGLRPTNIAGNAAYRVDPRQEDFYRRLIDLRSEVKARKQAAGDREQKERLDAEQQALKVTANATSYGVFVELNVHEHERLQEVDCYGPSGQGFSTWVHNVEQPGRYFHPLLGTLITGAARLMLAIAERLATDTGITWAFCDTDSMALARPEGMDDDEFIRRAERVRDWFAPLNPYAIKGPVFKIEEANYRLEDGRPGGDLEPLYCFAVSAKRYALVNLDPAGNVVLRKASAHGLGHLRPPYGDGRRQPGVPPPAVALKDLGVERWQHDLWYRIVQAALQGHSEQVALDRLSGFDKPAVSRYAATTTTILRWFDRYNEGRTYREQVRPFGFMLAFQAAGGAPVIEPEWWEQHEERERRRADEAAWQQLRKPIMALGGIRPGGDFAATDIPRSVLRKRGQTPDVLAAHLGYETQNDFMAAVGQTHDAARRHARRPRGQGRPRPVAPFDPDPEVAATRCFDRVTGHPLNVELRTYRQTLAQYHMHPEDKFLGGDYTDAGTTLRRHIVATAVEHIGKEANRWEEQFYLGEDESAEVQYGTDPADLQRMRGTALRAAHCHGQRRLAKAARVSLREVSAVVRGVGKVPAAALVKMCRAIRGLDADEQEREAHIRQRHIIAAVKHACTEISVGEFAEAAGVDNADLVKVLAGTKQAGMKMLAKLNAVLPAEGRRGARPQS